MTVTAPPSTPLTAVPAVPALPRGGVPASVPRVAKRPRRGSGGRVLPAALLLAAIPMATAFAGLGAGAALGCGERAEARDSQVMAPAP